MTDSKLPTLHGTPFAPRALVPVSVGHTTVNLYPVIDPGMPVEERAHAFQVNKTAQASAPINLRVQLDALGQQASSTWRQQSMAFTMTGSASSKTAGVILAV